MHKQQGFTLIELMIVVAIIGILAAVAIPAYQDYTIRAQVTEGLSLASGAKTAVSEYWASNGDLPADNDAAGMRDSEDIRGNNVDSVEFDGADIVITFSASAINGSTLTLAPDTQGGQVAWDCSGGDLEAQYRPSSCR